ncbi:acyl-CoA thioesterase [Streptomyces xanthochromogenes]|uniref:acyl-CoA thioesterase n=1 Tax=Streptomyces xanthochromogenes TaxID=67384 RepID=UPI0038018F1F
MSRHVVHCPLRWSDADTNGHINNVSLLRYLEEARVRLQHDLARALANASSVFVVARQEIEYKRPLLYRPEPVTIETWVTKIGGASVGLAYEIKDDEVYARSSATVVSFDPASNRPARIGEVEKTFLGRYLAP